MMILEHVHCGKISGKADPSKKSGYYIVGSFPGKFFGKIQASVLDIVKNAKNLYQFSDEELEEDLRLDKETAYNEIV